MIKYLQYLWIQEVHTIIPPHRHGSNLRHVIPKLRVPDYITYLGTCIYIFGQTGGVMAPKPMSTVGSAGNSIYYLQYANVNN